MTILTTGQASAMARAAFSPPPGMLMSRRITSGSSFVARRSASSARLALPDDLEFLCGLKRVDDAVSNEGVVVDDRDLIFADKALLPDSARLVQIHGHDGLERKLCDDECAPPGLALHSKQPPKAFDPLAHPDQPEVLATIPTGPPVEPRPLVGH